jgi:tRNA(His) 5'-end guanylyltransferase
MEKQEAQDVDVQQRTPLGDRMKGYEGVYNYAIPNDHYFVVRADGHGFSKFTIGLEKPFDERFIRAMMLSASDAMDEFKAVTAYTHSDEITLVFVKPDLERGQTAIYNGRVLKLASLVAARVSVAFNGHLKRLVREFADTDAGRDIYSDQTLEKINRGSAYFDARVLSWPENLKQEVMNHQIWRSVYDCHRNAVQTYAYCEFGPKKIVGKNGTEMIQMLAANDIMWDNVPMHHKYGVYIKKHLTQVMSNIGPVQRTKAIAMTVIAQASNEFLEFLLVARCDMDMLSSMSVEFYNL